MAAVAKEIGIGAAQIVLGFAIGIGMCCAFDAGAKRLKKIRDKKAAAAAR